LPKIGWPGRRFNVDDHVEFLDELRRANIEGAERVARKHAQRLADGVLNALTATLS
jgi:DNA-binding GntR family transcriptional regulator